MIKVWIACLFLLTVPGFTREPGSFFPVEEGLIVDLNADNGVIADSENRVEKWMNQVHAFPASVFKKTDEGREIKGSGMPLLKTGVAEINGHSSIVFHQQELLSDEEDAFDHLITGSGYTWFCVMKAGKQPGELKDVNSIFGNLRNGSNYEGLWAGLMDNNQPWMGTRNGVTFGRWDNNNPRVLGKEQLNQQDYYLLIGHMTAGKEQAMLSLYVNDAKRPVATRLFPVNPLANASKLAIGQERDATEHPGVESFAGEITRFLLYERPLSRKELIRMAGKLMKYYRL